MSEISEISVQKDTIIKNVEPIEESRNRMFQSRDEIKKYVEPPLIPACEHFWDLNIRTLSSSANTKDINESGYIILDYDSLSEENKKIATEHAELLEDYDGGRAVKFKILIDDTTTLEQVKKTANLFSERFVKQKPVWIPVLTLEELNNIYSDKSDEFGIEDFTKEGWFYDTQSQRFYISKEHYEKASEKFQ